MSLQLSSRQLNFKTKWYDKLYDKYLFKLNFYDERYVKNMDIKASRRQQYNWKQRVCSSLKKIVFRPNKSWVCPCSPMWYIKWTEKKSKKLDPFEVGGLSLVPRCDQWDGLEKIGDPKGSGVCPWSPMLYAPVQVLWITTV